MKLDNYCADKNIEKWTIELNSTFQSKYHTYLW